MIREAPSARLVAAVDDASATARMAKKNRSGRFCQPAEDARIAKRSPLTTTSIPPKQFLQEMEAEIEAARAEVQREKEAKAAARAAKAAAKAAARAADAGARAADRQARKDAVASARAAVAAAAKEKKVRKAAERDAAAKAKEAEKAAKKANMHAAREAAAAAAAEKAAAKAAKKKPARGKKRESPGGEPVSADGHSPSMRVDLGGGAAVVRDTWVQCTAHGCGKWRRVAGDADALDALDGDTPWTCADGTNPAFASCEEDQELPDDDIDALMERAAASEEEEAKGATGMGAPRTVLEPQNASRGTRKSAPSPPSSETAHQAPGVKARPSKRPRFDATIEGGAAPARTKRNDGEKARRTSAATRKAAGIQRVTKVKKTAVRSAVASPGSGAPPAQKRTAGAANGRPMVLGCSKCRYSRKGCRQCRSSSFEGARGPRVR